MQAITELVDYVIGERDQILQETAGRDGPDWQREHAGAFLAPMQEGKAFVPLFKAARAAVTGDHDKDLVDSLKLVRSKLLKAAAAYLRPFEENRIGRTISIHAAIADLDEATMALGIAANRLSDVAGVEVRTQITVLPDWRFEAGRCSYRKTEITIMGKPYQVLKAAVENGGRITVTELLDKVWGSDAFIEPGSVRNPVGSVRKVLREQLNLSHDPIPCVDRGKNLAWAICLEAPNPVSKKPKKNRDVTRTKR